MYTLRRTRNAPAICFTLFCLLAFAAIAVGQVDRATLNGTVTDASGAVVQNVKIELDCPATGLHRETETNSRGLYQVPALAIGNYKITMSKEGFKPVVFENVEFQVGQARTIDAWLQVGARTEIVEVHAEEALNRSSAEVGSVIESEQIEELPLADRNWAGLMAMAPGAINAGSTDQQHSIRFNGRSLDDENYAFDGIDASGVQEQAQKADSRLNISLESIAEFRVSTSTYTAESGAAGGAQINLVSKTGNNKFHGSAFDFLRNDVFDAKTYFDNNPLPPLRMNQFGAELGGPVFKNRTFFYMNYEGLRESIGDTQSGAFVPNAAARALVVATSPVLKPLVNAFPTGKTPYTPGIDPTWTDETLPYGTDTTREDYGMARIDHKFNDSTTAYVRGNIDSAHLDQPADSAGAHTITDITPANIVFALDKIFSPGLMNEAKFGVNRSIWTPYVQGSAPLDLSVSGDVPWSGLTGSSKQEEAGTTFSVIDDLTQNRGRNTLKYGVDIRRIRLNNSGNAITTSSISYTSFNDFANNLADSMTLDIGQNIAGLRRTFYMGYAQDEVKLTPNLTLNAGLRYEFYSVMYEVHGHSVTVSAACGGFCPAGLPFYKPNYNDYGPRLGLNWAPSALKGRTVVRGGFGIYFGANQNDDFSDPTESAVPRYSASTNLPSLQLYYGYDLTTGVPTFSPKAIDPNRKDLYYENWDFNIQQQLPAKFVAQVGYVGSGGRHLFSKITANGYLPETTTRPIPSLGTYGLKGNSANDNFNALQASLQRSFKSGFLWQTQYMWSHAITDGSIGAGEAVSVENNSCLSCDRSSSNEDVRHTFISNAVYQLPFGQGRRFMNHGVTSKAVGGWDLSGVMSARTGLPVNITITRKGNVMQDGITSGQRPNLNPGVSIYPATGKTLNNWFNFAAFAVPAKYTWGNTPRYMGVGPGNYEVDTALSKRTAYSDHGDFTFRAEAFNLFNHPMFANPSGSLGSSPGANSGFGKITSILNTGATGTGTPRRLQLSVRVDF